MWINNSLIYIYIYIYIYTYSMKFLHIYIVLYYHIFVAGYIAISLGKNDLERTAGNPYTYVDGFSPDRSHIWGSSTYVSEPAAVWDIMGSMYGIYTNSCMYHTYIYANIYMLALYPCMVFSIYYSCMLYPIGSMVLVYMLKLGVYWWDPCYHI